MAADMKETEEYIAFVDKFKPKKEAAIKTKDECYTPVAIYETVKTWVVDRFDLCDRPIIRPFYPGGDYQAEEYPNGCVVIDNPPFSIISQIAEWYLQNNIDFFIFAPTLTLFSVARGKANYVVTDCSIVYENGATVNTGFVTNMGDDKIVVSGDLTQKLRDANKKSGAKNTAERSEMTYPSNVISSSKLLSYARRGVEWDLPPRDVSPFIRELDSQRKKGKGIYGGGFLISDRAAQQRAALEKSAPQEWTLSERERQTIKGLGKSNDIKDWV